MAASLAAFSYLVTLLQLTQRPLFWHSSKERARELRSMLGPEWRHWYGTTLPTSSAPAAVLMALRSSGYENGQTEDKGSPRASSR